MPPTNFDEIVVSSGWLRNIATQERAGLGTIPTTVGVEMGFKAKFSGVVTDITFIGKDVLATSDTNYITWAVTNRGQLGAGSTAMLLATAAVTTKVTGGSALAAWTPRVLGLAATPANLVIAANDIIHVSALVTGTLANSVLAAALYLSITPS